MLTLPLATQGKVLSENWSLVSCKATLSLLNTLGQFVQINDDGQQRKPAY